jgi:hypothetical protein
MKKELTIVTRNMLNPIEIALAKNCTRIIQLNTSLKDFANLKGKFLVKNLNYRDLRHFKTSL